MQVTVKYLRKELNAAIKFIADHSDNPPPDIRELLIEDIKSMARNAVKGHEVTYTGSWGYIVLIDSLDLESIDHESNEVFVRILVDPSLGSRASFLKKEVVVDIDSEGCIE